MTSLRLISVLALTPIVLLLLTVRIASGQCIVESIVAPEGQGNIGFGIELAVGGDRFLVSSRFASGIEEDTGGVHIYRRTGRRVQFEQTLNAPAGSGDDRFGWSSAIEDHRIAVGAPLDDSGRGAVYVYQWIGGQWSLQSKVTADDGQAGDEFGRAVSLRGNYLMVGSPRDDEAGPGKGSAYIFKRDGSQWIAETKLLPDTGTASDAFGWNLAVSGDVAAISAHLDDERGLDSGAVYLFRRESGEWRRKAKLMASDSEPSSWFGSSISFDETRLLIGAKNHGGHGAAYLFLQQDEGNDGVWIEDTKFTATDADQGDGFGSKVAVTRDRVLITSANDLGTDFGIGATYLFAPHEDGWAEESKLTVPHKDGGNRFGGALAITAKIALIAGSFDDGRNGVLFIHHLLRPECRCMAGKVNSGVGPIRDALYVNGRMGGRNRTVFADEGELLTAYVLEPPLGGHGKFVVHANVGRPGRDTVIMPGQIGTACFAMLMSQGAQPIGVWNSIGRTREIGESQYFDGSKVPDPERAPAILFQLSEGDPLNLPAGTIVTFQGAIGDPGAAAEKEGSVTNAVVLEIQ